MAKKLLVTGASGFVGRELCKHLVSTGYEVIGVTRSDRADLPPGAILHRCNLEKDFLGDSLLRDVDCIVHLAGQAHGKGGEDHQELDHFRQVNVDVTLRLAKAALDSGVRRFVFVSSIGVHGAITDGRPISEQAPFNPESPYAVSKMEAELALIRLFEEEGESELTIVRPPLVYGDQAPGNFGKLLKLARMGIPLPLGRCSNRRNIISLSQLAAFMAVCIDHPAAGNETFVVAEESPVSTSDMVRALRAGMRRSAGLFPVPQWLMSSLLKFVGKRGMYIQLFCDLEIDGSKARKKLGWVPKSGSIEQLEEIGKRYADSLD
ncbi:NAD-dependent epimerase/dehydratase family protein [Marinobacter halodurans]|uniref:NAD-dependent epimerase/dehydratase family protein n=1 Tax=Marinobacter halodurans TaxID=2528979 RepID=A0ABY1ZLN5_9GAMM|nr:MULTISPECIES: NAD-dependent epimerase/dehydratase family protein [Marinobacter]ROT99308.1 NAD-dependent epimerase/dehydratase family protein [Marinobacter sp. R17]TBW56699.1 NAD-dependent epimerase/dehydratase family protein [Marinobacter halodurans]